MSGRLDRLEKLVNISSRWLNWVAGAGMVAMLALIVADVIGIKVFKWPIPGGIEIVGFLGVIITAFAVAYTQVMRGHIQVEFLVMRLPKRLNDGISAFVFLLGLALFVLLAWRSAQYGYALQRTGEVSMTQGIPFYLLVYAITLACVPVCLSLLAGFLRSVTKAVKT